MDQFIPVKSNRTRFTPLYLETQQSIVIVQAIAVALRSESPKPITRPAKSSYQKMEIKPESSNVEVGW
jgi:hypothetical protein